MSPILRQAQDKNSRQMYVSVVLPIKIDKPYSYQVPEPLRPKVQFGVRAEVQFGRAKRYAAIIVEILTEAPPRDVKNLIEIIDDLPIISKMQYTFWQWMATYYSCTIGEVMHGALPPSYKISSETIVYLLHDDTEVEALPQSEHIIMQALRNQREMLLGDIKKLLDKKAIMPAIHRLFRDGYVAIRETLENPYKPKIEKRISLEKNFAENPDQLHEALDSVQRSERQTNALLAIIQLTKTKQEISRDELKTQLDVKADVLKALEKKGIISVTEKEVNRILLDRSADTGKIELTKEQSTAYASILSQWQDHRVVLLQGVTGSGKTWIYQKLMFEARDRGEQTLYLLPEIALTIQIVQRLRATFGDQVLISHSSLSNNERVDLWKRVQEGAPFILGVRSSLFLPFKNLKLIIVDEEHDGSFKQSDPAPRYHGRDSAIYLSTLTGARVLLGTATPSIESYYNAELGKYGLVPLRHRYQNVRPPEMQFVDLRKQRLTTGSQFSEILISALTATLERKEQAIIFKNRRGYAPVVKCDFCGWHAVCDNCDIGMTYHQFRDNLTCHLCGTQKKAPINCPACGSQSIELKGYGTQKLEDELGVILPNARIKRMDFDSTRSKMAYQRLIDDFENQQIDILVGTQMVTKGLDFDRVGLVGVIHADQQLYFPHFRAVERTYQLLVQVSGRAGRKKIEGKVIIQTYNPDHPVFADVGLKDYASFYHREIEERRGWMYPPFVHLIKVTLKHKTFATVLRAAQDLAGALKHTLGKRVMGPAQPGVARVRNQYLMDVGIKIERKPGKSSEVKSLLKREIENVKRTKGLSTVRINVDVDPG